MKFFSLFFVLLCIVALAWSEEKSEENICSLPALEGGPEFCRARLSRYAYNVKTQVCEEFKYGGCGGNSNRFNTKEECEEKCKSKA